MEQKNYEEIYEELKDLGIMKIYDLGNETASALVNISREKGEEMVSKTLLPMLAPVMFKRFFLNEAGIEDDEFNVDGISMSLNKMIESGEYETVTSNVYYPLYLQIVNNYVDEANYYLDKGRQVLVVLSEFTREMQGFLEELNKNIDEDMLNQVRNLINGIVGKVESFTKLIELTNNLNK